MDFLKGWMEKIYFYYLGTLFIFGAEEHFTVSFVLSRWLGRVSTRGTGDTGFVLNTAILCGTPTGTPHEHNVLTRHIMYVFFATHREFHTPSKISWSSASRDSSS